MLVTFRSDAWSNITMFGDVAVTLLRMAGHSGTVPSAMLAGELPSALARLKRALAAAGDKDAGKPVRQAGGGEPDEPAPVGLGLRAYPLIELLAASIEQECDVMWAEGAPAF